MLLTNEIIKEIREIKNKEILQNLLAIIKRMKKNEHATEFGNIEEIRKFYGSISVEEANQITSIVDEEFNNIEGDW